MPLQPVNAVQVPPRSEPPKTSPTLRPLRDQDAEQLHSDLIRSPHCAELSEEHPCQKASEAYN